LFALNFQQFINDDSGFPTPALVPKAVSSLESLPWY
jgi:hypothetical protein